MFSVANHIIAIGLLAPMLGGQATDGECRHESPDDRAVAHLLNTARGYVAFGRTAPVFTPEAAEVLRFRLRFTRWLLRYDATETLNEPALEPMLKENRGRLLGALPPLPEGLEYRFHGRHLLLVDRRTEAVVDVLEGAQ